MIRTASVATAFVAAMVLSTVPVHAQGGLVNKRTYLNFSKPVEVPGVTLPAGRYIFQMTNSARQTVWQVLDAKNFHILTQFFYVETEDRSNQEQNAQDNKPIVKFHEAPQGTAPAVRVFFYPSDARGYVFVYPRAQAERIAAVTHQPVLASDSDAQKGAPPTIVTIGADTDPGISLDTVAP